MRIEKAIFSVGTEGAHRMGGRAWIVEGIRRAGVLVGLMLALAACGSPTPVASTADDGHVDLIIGATEPGGGALVMDYDFGLPFEVFESTSISGFTLWSGTGPGFAQAETDEPDEGVYALADGVTVSLEVTALEAGTQFRFGDVTVNEVGERVALGTVPDLHGHGEWQVTLPEGVETGDYPFSFRFVADSAYDASEPETAFLTPVEGSHDDDHDDGDDHDDDHDDHDDDHDDGDDHDDDHDDGDDHDDDHDDGDDHDGQ
ncbi:MAG: hypothetical protein P8R42_12800 [Candidatus Binatia bacterium]|nr:hypothetical protein [Candidatus Binatia bacterium]